MMMGNVSSGTETSLLLQIIADPERTKKDIQALVRRISEAESAELSLHTTREKTAAEVAALEKVRAEFAEEKLAFQRAIAAEKEDLAQKMAAHEIELGHHRSEIVAFNEESRRQHDDRLAELEKMKRALRAADENRTAELDKRQAELQTAMSAVERRDAELNHRDVATGHTLRAAEKAKAEAEALREKHQAQFKKIQSSLQSLTAVE